MSEPFRKYAPEVKNALQDVAALVTALGLMVGAKRAARGGWDVLCPHHGEKTPSCGVGIGPHGTIAVHCFGCQWKTDALGLIAEVRGYTLTDQEQFIETLAEGAEIAGHLALAEEIRDGRAIDPNRPKVEPPKSKPAPEYPPVIEVVDFWDSCVSVANDPAASKYLGSRSIQSSLVASRELLRAIAFETARPTWAFCKGLPWFSTGHRIIARMFTADGVFRSVRSWQCDGRDYPKRLPPSGHRAQGLVLANALGVEVLQGKAKAERVIIAEGEPDWVTASTRCKNTDAVFGIGSGFWTEDHAKKIPNATPVAIVTDSDDAGNKYASDIAATLKNRCPIWRINPSSGDLNDRAMSKELPDEIWDACVPFNDAARDWDVKNPRVYRVLELLQGSFDRATSKERPRSLTFGHFKLDQLTGGLRPRFMMLFIGETSWGKTSFVISMCDENMAKGARTMIVSFEDPKEMFGDRLMQRRSKVKATHIRDRCPTPGEMKAITQVVSEAKPMPFFLDCIGVTLERAENLVRNAIRKHKIDLVIFDYLQAIETEKSYQDERTQLTGIAKRLTVVTKTEGASGVICSQLTENTTKKTPDKYSGRGSKDPANAAEIVMIGYYQPEQYDDDDNNIHYSIGQKMIKVDKAKDGEKGVVGMDWNTHSACFDRVLKPLSKGEQLQQYVNFIPDNDADFNDDPAPVMDEQEFDDWWNR